MQTVASSINIVDIITVFVRAVVYPPLMFALKIVGVIALIILLFAIYAFIKLRVNPFTRGYRKVINLKKMEISFKPLDFIHWIYVDIITSAVRRSRFNPYGFTIYCGRQGGGKTISMIAYANYIHFRYPECIIVSNFKYKYANYYMEDWRDLFKYRNGRKGVLFLIDEIHSEYSSSAWKDFPESVLSEISQQRKQGIKICATAQVYSRVVKQIREQTYTVVQCTTLAGRWTFNKEYDSRDYEVYCENPNKKKKLKVKWKSSFIQDDFIRGCYDTYEKIKRMKKIADKPDGKGFMKRNERNA